MPHMAALLLLSLGGSGRRSSPRPPHACCPALAAAGRPGFFDDLRRALDGEGARRDVFRDHGAGADVSALADRQWGYEARVGPHEGAVTDGGVVLVDAVVVAGDGAGADVDAVADGGVADV